jgi:TolA-binding protein
MMYLKIIEQKGQQENVDFEHSYSQISNAREEIMNRKHVREIKHENEQLKQRLRDMNEEIEFLKFMKKEDNESMMFNQTSNPFKRNEPNHSHLQSPEKSHRNMY